MLFYNHHQNGSETEDEKEVVREAWVARLQKDGGMALPHGACKTNVAVPCPTTKGGMLVECGVAHM